MLCNIQLHFYNCVESLFQFHHALSHIIFLAGFSVCVTRPYVTILKILYVCLTKYVPHKALWNDMLHISIQKCMKVYQV